MFPTDARAPWQNGRTERAGAEWKKMFKYARHRDEPCDDNEFVTLGELCCSMRNRYHNRSGFSPMQRVFGFNTRLPNTLVSDDPIDPTYLSTDPHADFKRAEELREAATSVPRQQIKDAKGVARTTQEDRVLQRRSASLCVATAERWSW